MGRFNSAPGANSSTPYRAHSNTNTKTTMTNLERNRFYQMHDAMAGGYMPDVQRIFTTKEAAKEAARDRVREEYRGRDNLKVFGNAEDGYEIVRKDGPFGEELHRVVTLHGPMRAEEMGFDSLEHLIDHQGWGWRKGAAAILTEE